MVTNYLESVEKLLFKFFNEKMQKFSIMSFLVQNFPLTVKKKNFLYVHAIFGKVLFFQHQKTDAFETRV
jgi:hypothetical protein